MAGSDVEICVVQNNDRMVGNRRPWVREIMDMQQDDVEKNMELGALGGTYPNPVGYSPRHLSYTRQAWKNV